LCGQTTYPDASYWCNYCLEKPGGFVDATCLNVYFDATNQPACVLGPPCPSASLAAPGSPNALTTIQPPPVSPVSPTNGSPTGAKPTTAVGSPTTPTSSIGVCPTANIVAGGGCIEGAPVFQGDTLNCPCDLLMCLCEAGPGGVVSPSCGDGETAVADANCGVCDCPAQVDECSYGCGA